MIKTISRTADRRKPSVSEVCKCFGLSRDAYYKYNKRQCKREAIAEKVIGMVTHERKDQPRVGTRKLHEALHPVFKIEDLKVGRDKLFAILREYNMLVGRKKAYCKTTYSHHRFHKYGNLIKDMEITASNQVWVSDITYIRTVKGFCYLALVTDLFSRKIVGYDISDTLELTGCLRAFKRAQRAARPAAGLVHHSDRGFQYCSNEYVETLTKHKVNISMTQENHCYENAVAERVNGILKDEFYLDQCFFTTELARVATKNAIEVYNNKRLHLSLGYKTPNSVFKYVA
jgi:putative transposase